MMTPNTDTAAESTNTVARFDTGQSLTQDPVRESAFREEPTMPTRYALTGSSSLSQVGRSVIVWLCTYLSWGGVAVALLMIGAVWAIPDTVSTDISFTLVVFAFAVWMWMFSSLDDTFVALGAASALVLSGVIDVEGLFSALGDEQTWLLIGAFIVAGAVATCGLATRAVIYLCQGDSTPRGLVHTLTLATVATAYAIPATSGRAALLIPVFLALAPALHSAWLTKTLSMVLPVVILLSAVSALIGAGAHLITVQVLENNGYEGLSFTEWLVLGLPFGLVCSHIAAELILLQNSDKAERRKVVRISGDTLRQLADTPLSTSENRVLIVLVVTIVLWCTEGLHGIHPSLVAVIAALVVTTPWAGVNNLGSSIKKVPWSMILFMAATLAMSSALVDSGAADFLAAVAVGGVEGGSALFVVAIVLISAAAHLIIQSRSGRSAALVPIIIALAPVFGVNPVAAAFISTAAAGFCHTLPASAKPLALFSNIDGVNTSTADGINVFTKSDLRRFALAFLPIFIVVILTFSWFVWPLMGLPLFL